MRVILSYDIADARRLRRVAKILEKNAERLQRSVFITDLDEDRLEALERRLENIIDSREDSVCIIRLCGHCVAKLELHAPRTEKGYVETDECIIV